MPDIETYHERVRDGFRYRMVDAWNKERAADEAWQLIIDAWRVIIVASARADVPAEANREEWMAALQLAMFRAKHPSTTEPI